MSFYEVSTDAEKLLEAILKNYNTDYPYFDDSFATCNSYEEYIMTVKELNKYKLIDVTFYIHGTPKIMITGKGKDYFIKKQKYEEERKLTSININASDNSPVNLNTGSGQANQTVTIYSAEQHNAINEFRDEVQNSPLSQEEKSEVLELLDSMEELKAKNKTSSFKALLNRVNEIVTTSNTLHAIWQGV